MGRYLLDTNHLGAALDDRSAIRGRLFQARRAGHRLATTVPALCELHTGLYHTSRRDQNLRVLAVLLREIRVWPLETSVAPLYAEIFHYLRTNGRALSQVDMMLAATARFSGATLLTSDRDFEALPDILTENWLD